MSNVVSMFPASGIEIAPAGQSRLTLQWSTSDGGNLQVSYSITDGTHNYTVQSNSLGYAEVLVASGGTYTVAVTHQGEYLGDKPRKIATESTKGYYIAWNAWIESGLQAILQVTTSAGASVTATDQAGGTDLTATADSSGIALVRGTQPGHTYTVTATKDFSASATVEIEHLFQTVSLTGITAASLVVTTSAGASVVAKDTDTQEAFSGTATSGTVTLTVHLGRTYNVTATLGNATGSGVATMSSASVAISISLTRIPHIDEVSFKMSFSASTFNSDPKGCLTYSTGCSGFTPVSGPGSSLSACSVRGSWDMNADGTSSNLLLNSCFYATFDSSGNLHQRLNPWDLTQVIGLWSDSAGGWIESSGSSSITTENTMFCFPALYRSGTEASVTIGTTSASGTAYGATIDGHTYDYVAIGVYEGYVQGSKLMSLSGKASSANITRPSFRAYAAANAVKNGHAMLWNFHQWRDWWHLYLFAAKSFNGQVAIGQGGFPSDGSTGQGLCNKMGLWAGSTSTTASTNTSVKALIENPWGYKCEFIDDFLNVRGVIKVGQTSAPDDDQTSKTGSVTIGTDSGWQSNCATSGGFWGIPLSCNGSSSTCQCDYRWSNGSSTYLGVVGGLSDDVSDGSAGPSCLDAYGSLSGSNSYRGARLAFVFDL